MGMYTVLTILYLFLMLRRIDKGADELNSLTETAEERQMTLDGDAVRAGI
jgi:cytochrome bd-type quinol oxidase subunit 1